MAKTLREVDDKVIPSTWKRFIEAMEEFFEGSDRDASR